MKNDLKVKYLQYLSSKKQDEGFTLIELLVVIIIIGILSAIALPSFLNQAAKAKQSEAKTNVGAVVRAQQSFRMENTQFATDVPSLKIGIPTQTENYTYAIAGAQNTATVLAKAIDTTALKSFSGGVTILTTGQTSTISCQTTGVESQKAGAVPQLSDTSAGCPANMENMK